MVILTTSFWMEKLNYLQDFFVNVQEYLSRFDFLVLDGWLDFALSFWADFSIEFSSFFGGLLLFVIVNRQIEKLYKIEKNIKELWNLVLFLLNKRQASIPILYTISKRYNLLPPVQLENLLLIRDKSTQSSLRQNPVEKMKIEKAFSENIVQIFTGLERQQKFASNKILQKLGKDFEFIDQKLFEIQNTYNGAVKVWNNKFSKPFFKIFLWVFGFRRKGLF